MKKQILKGLFLVALLTVGVWACKKEEDAANKETTSPQNLVFTDAQRDESREFFAKTLAKACKDEAIQDFLKKEALRKIGGDYEVLYTYVKDNVVKDGKSFATLLQEQADRDLKTRDSKTTADFFKDFLGKIDPLLIIFLYAPDGKKVSDWDIKTTKEVTLCLPSVDDEKEVNLPTYKFDGVKGSVAVKTRPNDFYLVVRSSERFKAERRSSKTLSGRCSGITCDCPFSGDYFVIFPENCDPYDPYSGGNTGGSGTNTPSFSAPYATREVSFETNTLSTRGGGFCSFNSDRDNKMTKEQCYQFKFNNIAALDDLEPWTRGGPEMYCLVEAISASGGLAYSKLNQFLAPNYDRNQVFNIIGGSIFSRIPALYFPEIVSTTSPNTPPNMVTVTWDKNVYGRTMRYTWVEEDGGPKINFTLSGTLGFDVQTGSSTPSNGGTSTSSLVAKQSVSASLSVTDITGEDDDKAGDATVEYCDPADGAGTVYNTGRITFWVKHLN